MHLYLTENIPRTRILKFVQIKSLGLKMTTPQEIEHIKYINYVTGS